MSIPCGPGGRRGADTRGYLLKVQSRQKHWAAGLRALVVRGAVLVGVLPLGEPLPALPVPIGARSGQHIFRQVTGRAPAHARARPGTAWRREHGGAVALAHGPHRGAPTAAGVRLAEAGRTAGERPPRGAVLQLRPAAERGTGAGCGRCGSRTACLRRTPSGLRVPTPLLPSPPPLPSRHRLRAGGGAPAR